MPRVDVARTKLGGNASYLGQGFIAQLNIMQKPCEM